MTVNTLNWAGLGPIIILNFLHFNWRKIALVTSIFAPTHHKNTKILHSNLMRLGQMLLGAVNRRWRYFGIFAVCEEQK
jgi:hypothetical protein